MPQVRRLAIASTGFALAVLAAHYLLPVNALLPLAMICLILSPLCFAFKGLNRRRVMLVLLAMAFGFGYYRLHYEKTVKLCENLTNEAVTVEARVTAYPDHGENYSSVRLCITDDSLPGLRSVVFCYGDELDALRPGDELNITLKLRSAAERYGSYTDSDISKGLYISGNLAGDVEVTGRWDKSWLYFPQEAGNFIQSRIRELFPEDTAHFMLALLTGDRDGYYLDEELSSAMSISGVAHIVAVSGMHVAFLVGFLQLILGKNRRSSLVCIALVWVFVAMSGAPPSAIRAGFMQSLLLLAPILGRVPDKATGLTFALAVILLQNPFAIGSVGLQLSFAAMAGIYLFDKPIFARLEGLMRRDDGVFERVMFYVLGVFATSVSVLVFSEPLIAVHFGYVSLLGTVANILCIWAVSFAFCAGYFACAVGCVWAAAGKFLAGIVSYAVRYIALTVKSIAKLPFAAVYTENRLVAAWLILVYAMFAVCLLFKGRKKFRPIVPTALSVITLCAVLLISRAQVMRDTGTAAVLNVGSGQCIVLTREDSCVVVDCGSSGIAKNAGDEAAKYVLGGGRTKIDCLLLTHLHADHADGAVRLMGRVKIGLLLLPESFADEDELFRRIISSAEKNNVKVRLVGTDTLMSFGGIDLDIYAPPEKGGKNERGLMLTAKLGGKSILMTGDADSAAERELLSRRDLSDTDVLIVGHHGSKHSCSQELLSEARPQTAVISVGYNSYGHPSNTVLKRLEAYGAEIYRTDLMGRVIIR